MQYKIQGNCREASNTDLLSKFSCSRSRSSSSERERTSWAWDWWCYTESTWKRVCIDHSRAYSQSSSKTSCWRFNAVLSVDVQICVKDSSLSTKLTVPIKEDRHTPPPRIKNFLLFSKQRLAVFLQTWHIVSHYKGICQDSSAKYTAYWQVNLKQISSKIFRACFKTWNKEMVKWHYC